MPDLEKVSISDLEKMSESEIKEKLEELIALLTEVEEERMLVLGQENLHLHAAVAKNYEDELKLLKENIDTLKEYLNKRDK